ncbi:MAG: NERD domain-containing protein [Actinobacteria bacterium]|nr:NERD domain-containing protein [Actinomycetota bacterium]
MSAKPPGEYSRQQLHRLMVLVCILMGTAVVLAVMGFWWWPAWLLALPALWVLGRETDPGGLLDPLPHRKGERGENSVGAALAELPEGYRVHHGLEPGKGNVDHVVIGPTGVFAIETKNLTGGFEARHGRLTRDGFDASRVLRQARAEAMAIRDRLRAAEVDLWVEAIVACTGGGVKDGPLVIENVTVLSASCLRAFIINRRVRMSAGDVGRAETAILRSESADEHAARRTEGPGFLRRTL